MRLAIYCADIGSIAKGNFAWAFRSATARTHATGTDIEELGDRVATDLQHDTPVALGFECPLFVPFGPRPKELTRARRGEGNRPWSAGAGSSALATGLTETSWLLAHIHSKAAPGTTLHLSWQEFQRSGRALFIWEAFVTGSAKGQTHSQDAALAVEAFCSALPNPDDANSIHEEAVFSLIAAAALRAGWQSAHALLDQPCIVIRAEGDGQRLGPPH